mmetsp:Transcript_15816/g.24345  ORF Transcript_15816/g.24345 Transcript_15816/m.24345 type:complete len:90 (-) Transcript_15816:59-328(-)
MVKEFEIVDGFPVLDEFEHLEGASPPQVKPYRIDFRLPLKGINRQLLSATQLNVCNMFSVFYFLQLVVITRSQSLKVPGRRQTRSDNGF